MGNGERCLRGGWENSGTHLQTLLVLLGEQSSRTPKELLSSLLVIFSSSFCSVRSASEQQDKTKCNTVCSVAAVA